MDINIAKSWQSQSTFEGYHNRVYTDYKGIPTIGIGYNLNRADVNQIVQQIGATHLLDDIAAAQQYVANQQTNHLPLSGFTGNTVLSDFQIDSLYRRAANEKLAELRNAFPNFDQMDNPRQTVLFDMAFTNGVSGLLNGWPKFVAAVRAGNWTKAAGEMVNSAWYTQNRIRGVVVTAGMRTGTLYNAQTQQEIQQQLPQLAQGNEQNKQVQDKQQEQKQQEQKQQEQKTKDQKDQKDHKEQKDQDQKQQDKQVKEMKDEAEKQMEKQKEKEKEEEKQKEQEKPMEIVDALDILKRRLGNDENFWAGFSL